MYTDEDLYSAVKEGIFDENAVDNFRCYIANKADTKTVDEENFRLISGFNDIFVSISAFILLVSAGWIAGQASPAWGFLVAAIIAWLLSLFFVQRKRLALPAILFLVSFVISVVGFMLLTLAAYEIKEETALFIAGGVGVLAAWGHWLKFQVPITVAAGVASLVVCLIALIVQFGALKPYTNVFACGLGVLTFFFAMWWDSQDTARKTRKSDVAFWLHLFAAPLIVHPIFSALGILQGQTGLLSILIVILMYALLALVSIAVDRRALMVSSLVYVLYAFRALFDTYGIVSSSLAISGIFIGSVLLLLSAFWHRSRELLLQIVPEGCVKYLPRIN